MVALALVLSSLGQQTKVDPTLKVEAGFYRATFTSPKGSVTVILPDDISSGDTISGTLFPDAKAKDIPDIQVDLGDSHGTASEGNQQRRSWTIPNKITPRLSLTVWTPDGTSFGTTYIPIGNAKAKPTVFTIPFVARVGSPFVVKGPYNGDASDTKIQIGDLSVPVVAESPRQTVALAPSSLSPGESTLAVTEEKQKAMAVLRLLKVDLTTPKGSLAKGEKTDLTILVSGLSGVSPTNIPMIVVENLTPKTIDLDGKVKHFVFTKPDELGLYTRTFTITSLLPGGFSVSATVDPGVGTKVEPTKS